MQAIKKFFASLRVFKRLRVLEAKANEASRQLELAYKVAAQQGARLNKLESFIESREPCSTCGRHRYRQKTLHRAECG